MRDHNFTESFCIPSDLPQNRLKAWRLRPASAVKIYATTDFGNELVRLLYAAQYQERMQSDSRAMLNELASAQINPQLRTDLELPNQLRPDHSGVKP